jgi:predicted amidophosphoribosyltransferase
MSAAPNRWLAGNVFVRSGVIHDEAALVLVHRLKYEGVVAAADVLALPMLDLVEGASCLVPVVRTVRRHHRYGIDPALALAQAIRRRTGVPVLRCLRPSFTGQVRAGRDRDGRAAPRFGIIRLPPPGAVLVDDVITTGSTIEKAAKALGTVSAITATSRILTSSSPRKRPKHL